MASLVPGTLVVATLGLAILVALGVWQGQGYWEYSDGVYSLTARLILEGRELYREVAGAQPPTLCGGDPRLPPGTVYAGPPYLAFVAGVGIAGSQPDRFIIQASPVLADFRAAADGDGPVCP